MCKLIPKEENDNQTIIDKKIIEKVCPVCGYIFKKEIKKIIKNEPIITTYHGFFIYDLNKIEIENIIEGDYDFFSEKKGIVSCPKCGVLIKEKIKISKVKK